MRPISKLLTLTATAALFSTLATLAQEPPPPTETATQTPVGPPTPAPDASTSAPEASTFVPAPTPASTVTVPARGSTMESVRSKFGTPAQEQPAVGEPPITRWDYPGYAVFFEHDKVLHTVVARQ